MKILVDISRGVKNSYNFILYKGVKYIENSEVIRLKKLFVDNCNLDNADDKVLEEWNELHKKFYPENY